MFKLTHHIKRHQLEDFCRKHYIRKLAVFGSALRDELKPDSDIDILVEFEEGKPPGIITLKKSAKISPSSTVYP